ncbi:stalk domain-containing protein [Desulfallas thermosapovorans]|uniref:Copper amine oxidase-like protein n=1 Tax=Desulfallas thermosapovorans DSM 6562 TaxID=1121431 RepID=A0A5S4ZNT3_9FIRM|nr:stalk domain-containing protein [Desulfallas thermosapovorans]TYO93294.1 copper amine oxidase-like protein [Desulfallas thermosapovorans DSM 6562]
MKKLVVSIIGAMILFVTLSGSVLASPVEKVVFYPGDNKYIANGSELTMDAVPFVAGGRAYVPVRFLAGALGAEDNLTGWDTSKGTVSIALRGDKNMDITLQAGSRQLVINYLNGQAGEVLNKKAVSMDVTPVLRDGRIYLPARWIAEACGFAVEWDIDARSVLVYASGTKESPTGGVSVDTREIKSTTDQLKLSMEIPVISGMSNKALQEQINKEIMDKALQARGELETNYKEYAANAEKFDFPAHPFELYITHEVYTSGSILSLVVETYQYSGGAHGIAWRDYYNLDTKNGRQLSLQDLFKDDVDYVSILNGQIDKQIADQLNSGQGMYFEGDMGFQSILENHPFYLKDDHIVICFGQYEIAPYAAGMPEFQLPLDSLSRYWREDFGALLQ